MSFFKSLQSVIDFSVKREYRILVLIYIHTHTYTEGCVVLFYFFKLYLLFFKVLEEQEYL